MAERPVFSKGPSRGPGSRVIRTPEGKILAAGLDLFTPVPSTPNSTQATAVNE